MTTGLRWEKMRGDARHAELRVEVNHRSPGSLQAGGERDGLWERGMRPSASKGRGEGSQGRSPWKTGRPSARPGGARGIVSRPSQRGCDVPRAPPGRGDV